MNDLFVTPHNKDNCEDDAVQDEYEYGDHNEGVVEGEGVVLRQPERHAAIICCLCHTNAQTHINNKKGRSNYLWMRLRAIRVLKYSDI